MGWMTPPTWIMCLAVNITTRLLGSYKMLTRVETSRGDPLELLVICILNTFRLKCSLCAGPALQLSHLREAERWLLCN